MNILITGVHGFVGSNLVKALVPEHTIFGSEEGGGEENFLLGGSSIYKFGTESTS